MNRRIRIALAVVLIMAIATTVTIVTTRSNAPAAPPASVGLVMDRHIPDVQLIDDAGRSTSLAAYRGRYVVFANFLTLCQEECPLVTAAFLSMERAVTAAGLAHEVAFVEVTVDPQRDTPARLRAYAKEFGAHWALLTGTQANLNSFWRFLGIYHQVVPEPKPPEIDWYTGKPLTYDVDHTDGFILFDRGGNERFVTVNAPNLDGRLDPSLKGLLDSSGINNLVHPAPQSWTVADGLAYLSWLVGSPIPASG